MTTHEHEHIAGISVPIGYTYPREILRIDMPVKFVGFRSRRDKLHFFTVNTFCPLNDCNNTSVGESLTAYIIAMDYTVTALKKHLKYGHPVDLGELQPHEREMGNRLLGQYYETLSTALIETLRTNFS